MIRFKDGPASGLTLTLRRAPLYLRVVFNRKTDEWDALDQLDDVALPHELPIVAYRRVGAAGACFLDWTEKGRRRGGRFTMATYEVVDPQPDDATARDTGAWRGWCYGQQQRDQERAPS